MIFLRSLIIFIIIIFQFKAYALIEVDITRGNLSPLPMAISPLAADEETSKKLIKILNKKILDLKFLRLLKII